MRLVGLSKTGFTVMIFTQAAMFVLPAVILGFVGSIPLMYLLYDNLFTEDLGFEVTLFPETKAIIQALCLGLLIPTISAIFPIRRALSMNLNDSLSPHRSKSTGILIRFVQGDWESMLTYVLFGAISVLFGISIYYYLPMALYREDYQMMFSIFFIILLGMLTGLTILAMNL